MRNTIGKRIIVIILAPSLLIFGLLSAFIVYAASHFANVWAELELKGISEINAADLTGRVNSVQISILSAVSTLETIDAQSADGRERADNIVKALFENPHVYNAWLAYEPEAFDGRDSEHTVDYPGAPSGRFIRSYVMQDGQIVTAPDMDETTLDDPDESLWYVKPRDTGSFFTDAHSEVPNMYDYGLGEDPVCTMAFAAPIYRDGRVIGCVGADMDFDVTTLVADRTKHAAVAVFYPDGRVFFSQDPEFASDSVDTLNFDAAQKIMSALSGGSSLFLPNEYSMFFNTHAFTYFQPVSVSYTDKLYLYTAMPRSAALKGLEPVFIMIFGIVAASFIFVLFMLVYVKRRISDPIKSLMLAADAISLGDLETEIPSFSKSRDEIGVLSRSLQRMVEQFRVYILQLEQTQEEEIITSRIDDLMLTSSISEVMKGVSALLCEQFGVDKAMAVCLSEGSAHIFSRREGAVERIGVESPPDFLYHTQIMPMIQGKKLLLMNAYIISGQSMDFLNKETRFACILPLRDDRTMLGYIILESKREKTPFSSKVELILCSIAAPLAAFIKYKPSPDETAQESIISESRRSVRDVEGLDSATAIETMGGMEDLYEQALMLMAKLLPQAIERLDACISSDMAAFIIEIHGLKGSLNNVGAYGLGAEAASIEKAAKDGDSLCSESYASFKDRLTEFHRRFLNALKSERGKLPGDVRELVGVLPETEAAADRRDRGAALLLLRPMNEFSFDPETDALLLEVLNSLETLEDDKALADIRSLRERLAHWEEA